MLWHCRWVTENLPQAPSAWVSVAQAAKQLGVSVSKAQQMIREGALLAVRRNGEQSIPVELVAGRAVVKHLPGVLTLLRDAGYNDEEALRWLYTPDETLPGTAAVALDGYAATEVKRRAQALGF